MIEKDIINTTRTKMYKIVKSKKYEKEKYQLILETYNTLDEIQKIILKNALKHEKESCEMLIQTKEVFTLAIAVISAFITIVIFYADKSFNQTVLQLFDSLIVALGIFVVMFVLIKQYYNSSMKKIVYVTDVLNSNIKFETLDKNIVSTKEKKDISTDNTQSLGDNRECNR